MAVLREEVRAHGWVRHPAPSRPHLLQPSLWEGIVIETNLKMTTLTLSLERHLSGPAVADWPQGAKESAWLPPPKAAECCQTFWISLVILSQIGIAKNRCCCCHACCARCLEAWGAARRVGNEALVGLLPLAWTCQWEEGC